MGLELEPEPSAAAVNVNIASSVQYQEVESEVYTVLEEARCGRLLVAARDILPGELILTDTAAAAGPDGSCGPVCLTCYKRIPTPGHRCRYCGAPLCSPHCECF